MAHLSMGSMLLLEGRCLKNLFLSTEYGIEVKTVFDTQSDVKNVSSNNQDPVQKKDQDQD